MKTLLDSIANLDGVGPKSLDAFAKLGVETVNDLFYFFPRRFEDITLKSLDEALDEERIAVKGEVLTAPIRKNLYRAKVKSILNFKMSFDDAVVDVTFFNQPWLVQHVEVGDEIIVYGKFTKRTLSIAGIKILSKNITPGDFEAVYPLTKGLNLATVQKAVASAFENYIDLYVENLPEKIVGKYQFPALQGALRAMHYPDNNSAYESARGRFVYEEFLEFEQKMLRLKNAEEDVQYGRVNAAENAKIDIKLPFEMTGAQKRVCEEILSDLKSPRHMQRLVLGDVGSGKSAVAAAISLPVIKHGGQVALMVPTEVLAKQHFESFAEMLGADIKVALLLGSTKTRERREMLEQLATGEIDFLIGTHALFQKDVIYSDLALAIIDEQHRFGVEQRKTLREKGENTDVLFMTATPIPRTLAITEFGQLDLSQIDEMPVGRKAIQTKVGKLNNLAATLKWVGERELAQGHQMYVVCPLIEESELVDLSNAQKIYEDIAQYYDGFFAVGLMHGKMAQQEKDEMIAQFTQGELKVLVSTTIIEVGVNVPEATVMLVMDANRFGLSQLHQLRGRVGRSSHQSYCFLLSDSRGETALKRLKIMEETNDGFKIAQADLEIRGPGDFFGKNQSGGIDFQIADIVRDEEWLYKAREDAERYLDTTAPINLISD
ncbi:MAG: ATP-dependent DNA helicase RecG [Lactobacillales bacterium]|jgi:ATP-dependent DNA helicase RecG|nr:ATP-dependent DNA helicase RecG [Lactobacillales bacterium]